MALSVPQPSKRFLRAATGEREDLIAHRRRLEADRARLVEELRTVDDALSALGERLRTIDLLLGTGPRLDGRAEPPDANARPATDAHARLATDAQAKPAPDAHAKPANTPDASTQQEDDPTTLRRADDEPRHALSGPAIREAAVRVVLQQPEYIEALHYRRWYELLSDAGYAVAGKDPLAVFLTQLTRSPVIRKASKAGVYELDRQAPLRLRQRLERLHAERGEVTTAVVPDSDIASVRARRHELDLSIAHTERALEEALRALRREDGDARAPLALQGRRPT